MESSIFNVYANLSWELNNVMMSTIEWKSGKYLKMKVPIHQVHSLVGLFPYMKFGIHLSTFLDLSQGIILILMSFPLMTLKD